MYGSAVPQQRAKTFSYAVSLDREWTGRSDQSDEPLPHVEGWTPEHLLLAGLARCTLTSLRYHAKQAGVGTTGAADARGSVTKRKEDERYAFVEVEVALDVTFEPEPPDVRELLAKAERDCFLGASLTSPPRYSWIVDGEEIT